MNVADTVQDFWVTRPHRPNDERKFGGVAAGLGRRYAVDPVLIRVAFVVATFLGGAGVLLYMLGWLLLPDEGDEVSAAESLLGRRHSSTSPGLTLLLGLALIPATGIVLGGDAYGVIGLAAAGAALFLLHRSRAALGQLPVPSATPGGPADNPSRTADPASAQPPTVDPAGAQPAGADPPVSPSAARGLGGDRPPPPPWDPLGAAPFAWDLPDPAPAPPQEPPPPRAPRSKVTPITLGLALLVGGIASAFWPALSVAHIVALVLGVIGLGLVVGSLVPGGRGLIAVAVPLALLTWVLHAVPVSGFRVGKGVWAPATVAQVQPRYDVTMGNSFLDLSKLRVADGQTVTTHVTVGLGEARVVLPPDVDAEVICRVPVGAADCLGVSSSSIPAEVGERNTGRDGPGGGTLVLDVRAGVGNVQVVRGS